MKFVVTRTSDDKGQPCKNATSKTLTNIHRHYNPAITYTEEKEFWVIEIHIIEDIINFAKEQGQIIIEPPDVDLFSGLPVIEIYDQRRED